MLSSAGVVNVGIAHRSHFASWRPVCTHYPVWVSVPGQCGAWQSLVFKDTSDVREVLATAVLDHVEDVTAPRQASVWSVWSVCWPRCSVW